VYGDEKAIGYLSKYLTGKLPSGQTLGFLGKAAV
jgi:hypothetical protein